MTSPQYIRPLVVRHITNEELSGIIDGVNVTFNTQHAFIEDHITVFLNGLKLNLGIGNDFTILNNNTIIMQYSPLPGDVLIADYLRKL